MPLDQLSSYLPVVAMVVGGLLLLWSLRGPLVTLFTKASAKAESDTSLSATERFERLYALRCWCEQAGKAEAVKALDGQVLPAIVSEGGPKP